MLYDETLVPVFTTGLMVYGNSASVKLAMVWIWKVISAFNLCQANTPSI